jgi:NAD(P)-dependent dehydrogenase (short-subunit alcohol dehydrogenase family)
MGTIDPFPGFFGYAAAKAATNLMALSCANEGREFGIRAFAVAPGAVETAMLRSLFPESKLPSSQTMKPSGSPPSFSTASRAGATIAMAR